MKRCLSVMACLTWLAAPAAMAAELTAAQIVENNVAARGGLQAWRAIDSLTMSGEMDAGGRQNSKLPFVWTLKRPHKSRLEIRFQDQTAVQVYDGKQGLESQAFPEPQRSRALHSGRIEVGRRVAGTRRPLWSTTRPRARRWNWPARNRSRAMTTTSSS